MPVSGLALVVAPWTAANHSRAVSSPSRATDRKATTTTATDPSCRASLSFSRRSPDIRRAAVRIQKIMKVTKTVAASEAKASNISCCREPRLAAVNVSNAPNPTESATAAPTPAQTSGRRSPLPLFTRKATRMETTRVASRPSRRPMRKLANTSPSG